MLRVLVGEKEGGGEKKGEAEMKRGGEGDVERKERQRQVSTQALNKLLRSMGESNTNRRVAAKRGTGKEPKN